MHRVIRCMNVIWIFSVRELLNHYKYEQQSLCVQYREDYRGNAFSLNVNNEEKLKAE